jgi:Flp pilus assembly protein TadG
MRTTHRRRGATTVETAIVMSVFFVLLIAILVTGIGVFRYQQVAWLAREAGRYASVHGDEYAKEFGKKSPTQQEIIDNAITPYLVGMDPTQVTVTVEVIDGARDTASAWDTSNKAMRTFSAKGEYVSNRVRVTVTYPWTPGVFGTPVTVGSTTDLPITN